jgi:hypothetical protein
VGWQVVGAVVFPAGVTVGVPPNGQIELIPVSGAGKLIFLTNNALEAKPAEIESSVAGSGATEFLALVLFGPVATSQGDSVYVQLNTANAGPTSDANGILGYVDVSNDTHEMVTWSSGAVGINGLATMSDGATVSGGATIDDLVVTGNNTLSSNASESIPTASPSLTTLGSTWDATTADECNANFVALRNGLGAVGIWL